MKEEYRPSLSLVELLGELSQLLERQRLTERLVCRYLADMSDRMEGPDAMLNGYVDVYHLARSELGLALRSTRERVRVGRALRDLPQIERAFVEGEISYSKVRELTRVARAETERAWLDAARELPVRELERRVVAAAYAAAGLDADEPAAGPGAAGLDDGTGAAVGLDGGTGAGDEGEVASSPRLGRACHGGGRAETQFLSPNLMELRMRLEPDVWALLERALQGARDRSESSLSDAEALAAVARDALAQQDVGESDPRKTVVLYECRHCMKTELDTRGEPMDLSPGHAAALGCGARVVDLEREGRLVRRGGPLPGSVRRGVLLRDRGCCRVPGCGRRRYVDVHHIEAQSDGGVHSRNNCVTLCSQHHQMLHEGKLAIEGDADGEVLVKNGRGEVMVDPLAMPTRSTTQSGSPVGVFAEGEDTTQSGSPVGVFAEGEYTTQSGSSANVSRAADDSPPTARSKDDGDDPTAEARKLLGIMGRRGGWYVGDLLEASGLDYGRLSLGLFHLQIQGHVTRDEIGRYSPTRRRTSVSGAASPGAAPSEAGM